MYFKLIKKLNKITITTSQAWKPIGTTKNISFIRSIINLKQCTLNKMIRKISKTEKGKESEK